MIYDLTEQSITNCYDTFTRELNSLHNNNNKADEDEKQIQKDIQRKITILNAILTSLSKLKTYYKKI